MNESISRKVLELFEKQRKEPGAGFDQSYFLDFLMTRPEGKGAFRNSFSGLRRFNAFLDEVQLEFGVCFSVKDRETNYSLNDFCARIEELQKSGISSRASLKNRSKRGFEWNIFLFANALLIAIAVAVSGYMFLAVIIWFGISYMNYRLVIGYLNERRYIRKLEARIFDDKGI